MNTHFACLGAFTQHRLLPLHWLCCADLPHAPLSWLEGHAYNSTSLCALTPKFPQAGLSCPLRSCWILSFLDQVPKTTLKCLCNIYLYFPPAHTIRFFPPKLVMVDAICQYYGKNRHNSQHNCGVVIVAQKKGILGGRKAESSVPCLILAFLLRLPKLHLLGGKIGVVAESPQP